MSWDVYIEKFDRPYRSVQDVPDNAKRLILGKRNEIHNIISLYFNGTDWTDPTLGIWRSKHGSIEFYVGAEDIIDFIVLHVRANTSVVPMIIMLVQQNGWQAIDGNDGVFLEQTDNPQKGLKKWLKFRNKIIKDLNRRSHLSVGVRNIEKNI